MNQKEPKYLVKSQQGKAYYFRSTIPKHLMPILDNKREIRLSLQTGLYLEALKLSNYFQLRVTSLYQRAYFYQGSITTLKIKFFLKQ